MLRILGPLPLFGHVNLLRDLFERVDTSAGNRGVRRAEWLRQAACEAVTVQASRYTEGRRRSATELARLVAQRSEWAWAE